MFDNMQRFEARAFLVLVLIATALFFWLILPFFNVFLWSVVIAAVFTPLVRRLRQHAGLGPNLAALVTVLLALFLIILPLAWILYSGAREALLLYNQLTGDPKIIHSLLDQVRAAFPKIQDLLQNFGYDMSTLSEDLSSLALSASGFLAKYAVAFGSGAANFVTNLALVLYISFFFVRDSATLSAMLIRALPFGDHREKRLMTKFAGVMRATIKGSLLVAMAQGALGGLIFWILDIRAAVLWGVAMAILSLIPIVGAAIIWLPTAIYLLSVGNYLDGLVLIVYGACVIGLADNILRPILVRRDTKLPDYLILVTTLSGFALFGMDGFVTGPLIAVVFVTVWQIFTEETVPGAVPDAVPAAVSVAASTALPGSVPAAAGNRTGLRRKPSRAPAGRPVRVRPLAARSRARKAAPLQAPVTADPQGAQSAHEEQAGKSPAHTPLLNRQYEQKEQATQSDDQGRNQAFWQRLNPFRHKS